MNVQQGIKNKNIYLKRSNKLTTEKYEISQSRSN